MTSPALPDVVCGGVYLWLCDTEVLSDELSLGNVLLGQLNVLCGGRMSRAGPRLSLVLKGKAAMVRPVRA